MSSNSYHLCNSSLRRNTCCGWTVFSSRTRSFKEQIRRKSSVDSSSEFLDIETASSCDTSSRRKNQSSKIAGSRTGWPGSGPNLLITKALDDIPHSVKEYLSDDSGQI